MIVALVGVLEDQPGGRRGAGVPANPRTTLNIPQGADVVLQLTVLHAGGAPVDLAGCTVTWTAKRKPQDASTAFKKTGTAAGAGRVDFALASADTKNLGTGRYVYDIVLVSAGGARDTVVPASPLILEPAVTPL